MTVHVGIAGWSYPDWAGIVHPKKCRDVLRFCAKLVDCLEINSSFYAIPQARITTSWARRVEDLPAWFTAKLPQVFTHELRLEPADVAATRAGFAPLAAAGKLRALLLQFSHAFHFEPARQFHLAQLVEAFGDVAPLVVEVRHRSWLAADARAWLAELGVTAANLDYPGMAQGFGGGVVGIDGAAQLAYLRLHGRNTAAWFRRGAERNEVYDHEYTRPEVAQLERRIEAIAAGAQTTVVIANNHFHGKGMKVALELLAWLRGGPVTVPEELVRAYPSLQPIARPAPRGLFDP